MYRINDGRLVRHLYNSYNEVRTAYDVTASLIYRPCNTSSDRFSRTVVSVRIGET